MGVNVIPSFNQLRNKPTTVAEFGIADMASQTCGAVPFSGVTGKPTTMTGYGITDEKCKAWVNFNGTGTVAIRAAFNVSSITDNGVGNYTVNLINAMPDVNYAAVAMTNNSTGSGIANLGNTAQTTNSFNLFAITNTYLTDATYVQAIVFR